MIKTIRFDERESLKKLRSFLPSQSPLKDFIHHNTLHAFQDMNFHDAMRTASGIFGYKTYLKLEEYRQLYEKKTISEFALNKSISEHTGAKEVSLWKDRLIKKNYDCSLNAKVGSLRNQLQELFNIDFDKLVHPTLFRILNSYLDQGIAINSFPVLESSFTESLRNLNKHSFISLLHSKRTRLLLNYGELSVEYLLMILLGDESLFETYLFDQQFAHPGWSGMVSNIEEFPEGLIDKRNITLKELIIFELLLEIDALDTQYGESWEPLCKKDFKHPGKLFSDIEPTELSEVMLMWQDAYEWSYYPEVFSGIQDRLKLPKNEVNTAFYALFCIDDRECSLRMHLEQLNKGVKTFGTPGFFNLDFYFKPENSQSHSKVCPAPMNVKHIIMEKHTHRETQSEIHFKKQTHSLFTGWLISQTLGFWSALKLFIHVFKPTISPATTYSFRHMDHHADLTIENTHINDRYEGLQIGFTIDEMAERVEGLLRGIGLIEIGAQPVYVVGHGASSINNTHYAAYDCGACSGRPGSVNARAFAYMGNHPAVRQKLIKNGINIHPEAVFIGALHDTTRDEIEFYDCQGLDENLRNLHLKNEKTFELALHLNAKERSRRFILTDTKKNAEDVHKSIKRRSVSLFEPRPELNHSNNSLCIIGRRELTRGLFLDRRAFLNSYDYGSDKDGKLLMNILKAAVPVCGGINLEYYFSKVDNQKLGAGSKLPHNVMGLIGVSNGTDGDLRTGLPLQMIEVHDPIRLMFIVEQYPEIVLKSLERDIDTYEWFVNSWLRLCVVHPETHTIYEFRDGSFVEIQIETSQIKMVEDIMPILESTDHNVPVHIIE